jgi:crotonobetainyl-CoA:carnitine CoA-transferase CaiB-like acyl-CoA transferase
MAKTPARVRRRAPRLGEHTEQVLHEWLGIEAAEVRALTDRGIV